MPVIHFQNFPSSFNGQDWDSPSTACGYNDGSYPYISEQSDVVDNTHEVTCKRCMNTKLFRYSESKFKIAKEILNKYYIETPERHLNREEIYFENWIEDQIRN